VSRRFKQAAVVLVVALAAAQLIRPGLASVATDDSRSIRAQMGAGSAVAAVLDRSCGDCHSNKTVPAWYTRLAPFSWLIARGVSEGRKVVDFSAWASYSPDQQRALLAMSCESASAGRMPGIYTLVRADTRLSKKDVDTICGASK